MTALKTNFVHFATDTLYILVSWERKQTDQCEVITIVVAIVYLLCHDWYLVVLFSVGWNSLPWF